MILVGLKADLRELWLEDEEKKERCISTEEGKQVKQEMGFMEYMECSAKTRHKLTDVFFKSVKCHFLVQKRK